MRKLQLLAALLLLALSACASVPPVDTPLKKWAVAQSSLNGVIGTATALSRANLINPQQVLVIEEIRQSAQGALNLALAKVQANEPLGAETYIAQALDLVARASTIVDIVTKTRSVAIVVVLDRRSA